MSDRLSTIDGSDRLTAKAKLHAAEHIDALEDPIPDATLLAPGLMSAADKAALDNIAVFAGAGADGLVPDPVAETGKFLKDDGTWAAPSATATDPNAIHVNASAEISAIAGKTTPVDADVAVIEDSAASNAKKSLTWANIKATLKTYLDTLYAPVSHALGSSTHSADTKANLDAKVSDGNLVSNIGQEFNTSLGIAAKASPVGADLVLIEDSADSFNKKKLELKNREKDGFRTFTIDGSACTTSNTTYTVCKRFVFRGSNAVGAFNKIKAVMEKGGAGAGSARIRVYDVTNALTIAEATGITGAAQIVDLGTVSNVPTGEAMLEIQHSGVAPGTPTSTTYGTTFWRE